METLFTWDPVKAGKNLRKHGISFEAAQEAFEDSNQYVTEDRISGDEQRIHLIGFSKNLLLLLVVFVDRSEPGVEVIHIISARKANTYEENLYRENLLF